jgi:hypothetical protein
MSPHRIVEQLVAAKTIRKEVTIQLCLAVGKIVTTDSAWVDEC